MLYTLWKLMLYTCGSLACILIYRRYVSNTNRLVTYVAYSLEATLYTCGGLSCISRRYDFNANRLVTYVVYALESYVVHLWELSPYTYPSKIWLECKSTGNLGCIRFGSLRCILVEDLPVCALHMAGFDWGTRRQSGQNRYIYFNTYSNWLQSLATLCAG